MSDKITIIGIDGGASKVSAHIVEVSENGKSFSLSGKRSVKEYRHYPEYHPDFKPVSLPIQLSQININNINLTEAEEKHAKAYYSAFNDAISDLVKLTKAKNVLIGIGMPGVKTTDERGIAAMANGPRMPNFATEIEQRLDAPDITLAAPISKLGSDADYCGFGEEYSENGAFRNIENAYYLGGGTGAADALKLHGELISFDECKNWIAKTWEMSDKDGKSMEVYCSANGIQSIYSKIASISQGELISNNIYIEKILKKAIDDEKSAIKTWQIVSKKLAKLLFERIFTIYNGSQNIFSFINPNRKNLDSNHNFRRTLLNRIIIGQRLGNVFQTKSAQEIIIKPLIKYLSQLIKESNSLDSIAKSHYLLDDKFNKNILVASELREAPELGAGINAFKNYKG